MTAPEAAWLAGILEGEGSFLSGKSIAIQVTMTDLDVLERLQPITGLGRVLPWLGARRSVAASQLLDRIADRQDRAA